MKGTLNFKLAAFGQGRRAGSRTTPMSIHKTKKHIGNWHAGALRPSVGL